MVCASPLAAAGAGTESESKKMSTESAGGAIATAVAQAVQPQPQPPLHEHPTLQQMLAKNNAIRGRLGLRAHRISPELTKAAQDHANYMASRHNFDHYANGGPNGRAYRYGFQGGGIRENIARGQGSVESAFGIWQASGAHFASLRSNTTDAGFGMAISRSGTPYWVAVYGNGPAPRVEVLKPESAE
jgi:uncharacterized protein YkwD